MDMNPVKSSNIHSVGYDSAEKEMHVKFKDGGTYKYSDVPEAAHKAFVSAESVGKHFHANIKGKYTHRMV